MVTIGRRLLLSARLVGASALFIQGRCDDAREFLAGQVALKLPTATLAIKDNVNLKRMCLDA